MLNPLGYTPCSFPEVVTCKSLGEAMKTKSPVERMMQALASLSGWHPQLSTAELKALLPRTQITPTSSPRIVGLHSFENQEILSIHSSLEGILLSGGFDGMNKLQNFLQNISSIEVPTGTMRVTCKRHGPRKSSLSPSALEKEIGAMFFGRGAKISLTDPEHIFCLIIDEEANQFAWGWWQDFDSTSNAWNERNPSKRPFFKPISLDPRLARCAVNLACGDRRGYCVDPMAGTGGFLIEASLTGRGAYGLDVDSLMVSGIEKNLRHYGLQGIVKVGDASSYQYPENIAGIALDPPYGRNSQPSSKDDLLLKILERLYHFSQSNTGLALILPLRNEVNIDSEITHVSTFLQKTGWEIIETFEIPVHRSLKRLLIWSSISPQEAIV